VLTFRVLVPGRAALRHACVSAFRAWFRLPDGEGIVWDDVEAAYRRYFAIILALAEAMDAHCVMYR